MTRDEAMALLEQYVPPGNIYKHMLAAEAAMAAVAGRLGEDVSAWRLAGLLHDLDYEQTKGKPSSHGRVTCELLRGADVPLPVLDAILAHNQLKAAETQMERALVAVDPTTGFIVAAALMHPTKALAGCDVPFLMKRFKEKRFAAGADREQMASCRGLGLEVEEFLGLCLAGMTEIARELGL